MTDILCTFFFPTDGPSGTRKKPAPSLQPTHERLVNHPLRYSYALFFHISSGRCNASAADSNVMRTFEIRATLARLSVTANSKGEVGGGGSWSATSSLSIYVLQGSITWRRQPCVDLLLFICTLQTQRLCYTPFSVVFCKEKPIRHIFTINCDSKDKIYIYMCIIYFTDSEVLKLLLDGNKDLRARGRGLLRERSSISEEMVDKGT